MLLSILSLLSFSAACVGQWVGTSPRATNPSMVDLFTINQDGTKGNILYTVSLGSDEFITVDAFRCKPYGTFCLLSTNAGSKGGITGSYLYNITLAGTLTSCTALPGVILRNLHVDHTTGAAYTVAISTKSEQVASMASILNGQLADVVDISKYLGTDGTIRGSATTQCSDSSTMWIGVESASTGDSILTVNYALRSVVSSISLQQPLPSSLWADCDTQAVGGSVLASGSSVLEYVTLQSDGSMSVENTKAVPNQSPPLAPSGLLSQPSYFSSDFFIALYPQGSGPLPAPNGGGQTGVFNVSGFFAYGQFASTTMTLLPIPYYCAGAAAVSWNR